jgi:hypothetical protein
MGGKSRKAGRNPWLVFLQKHRALNPNMSVTEAAKTAGVLYKKAKVASNVVLDSTRKVFGKKEKKEKKGKKSRGKKSRGKRSRKSKK